MNHSSPYLSVTNQYDFLDPARKQRYVNAVFATVAPSYDQFTRWSSLGLDMVWKRELLVRLKSHLSADSLILDLACGTGDLTFALARRMSQARVIGMDISTPMLSLAKQARQRQRCPPVAFCAADIMRLPLPAGCVDAVTISYGLRNCPTLPGALAEIHRVLRPGGLLAALEFSRPRQPIWRQFFLSYLWLTGAFLGWLWHRRPDTYLYLARSVAAYHSWEETSQLLRQTGFQILAESRWLFDAVCIHVVQKKM